MDTLDSSMIKKTAADYKTKRKEKNTASTRNLAINCYQVMIALDFFSV